MKKVLVGVGIGCGVLVLLGVVGMVVAGFWAKRTFGDSIGDTLAAGQQMQAQNEELKALNQSFPFTPPPEGEMLALDEARLDRYFTIREATLPVFKELEEKGKALEQASEGQEADLSNAVQASSLLAQFMTKTRAAYIENLKKHNMSPREFLAISGAIYSSHMANSLGQMNKALAGQAEGLRKQLAEFDEKLQDDSLSEDARTSLEEQREMVQLQLDALNESGAGEGMPQVDEKTEGLAAANVALLEKYKERLEKAYNPAFDAILVTDDTENPFGNVGQQ